MNEDNSEIEQLFEEISRIKEEYSKEESFNPYQIFRLNDKEVMHSRFIKSLLNPNEIHGFKNIFLKLFLKRIGIKGFYSSSVTAECEKNTHNNRFIDIVIENKKSKKMIIIENKIWAKDIDNQLSDYYEFGLRQCDRNPDNVYVVYLTPYGRQPASISFPKEKGELIKCISYEKDILNWLDDCLKRIENKQNKENKDERIHLCIKMYMELIRKTINRDKYMEEILMHLVNNPDQMGVAIDVIHALQYKNFIEPNTNSREIIKERIISYFEKYNFIDTDDGDKGNEWYTLVFRNKNVELEIVFAEGYIYENHLGYKSELKINCTNLQDKYLVALLTDNQEIIQEWITKTINRITCDVEK